jgi:hypothetical protein
MTHRVFSRNASSSRAIPVKRMIEDLNRDPAMPVFWGSNKPGMQAGDELAPEDIQKAKRLWLQNMDETIRAAQRLMDLGLHKQTANRILEPFCHINVVVTATEWDNFWELRCHPDAQPEMRVLAELMRAEMEASTPAFLRPGEWHLPYVIVSTGEQQDILKSGGSLEPLVQLSVARCARVSYFTHEGKDPNPEEDWKLFERLVGSRPLHASPAEHQATPDEKATKPEVSLSEWLTPEEHGNFVGWRQFRKQLEARHTI